MTTSAHLPAIATGTWNIDPVHSEVGFVVRHMMVSKVRGGFADFSGTIVIAEDALASKVDATIQVASVSTKDDGRDTHLKSPDFFDVENHPTITYHSTSVEQDGNDFVVHGDLTIKGVTRPTPLALEFNGTTGDPYGGTRAGFSAKADLSRSDFGMEFNIPMDGGGVVVSDKVQIVLEVEAVLQQDK